MLLIAVVVSSDRIDESIGSSSSSSSNEFRNDNDDDDDDDDDDDGVDGEVSRMREMRAGLLDSLRQLNRNELLSIVAATADLNQDESNDADDDYDGGLHFKRANQDPNPKQRKISKKQSKSKLTNDQQQQQLSKKTAISNVRKAGKQQSQSQHLQQSSGSKKQSGHKSTSLDRSRNLQRLIFSHGRRRR